MGGAGQNSFAKTMRVSLAAAGSAVYIDTKLQMEVVRAAKSLQGSPFSGVTGHPSIPAWVQSSLGAGAGGALNKYARQLDRLASETGG